MKVRSSMMATALGVISMALVATGCTSAGSTSAYTPPSCSQLLSAAIAYERSGTGDIDSTMQALTDGCSDEYDIAVDYLSNATDSEFSIDSCDELIGYGTREESVALLAEDGRCTFASAEEPLGAEWPEDGLGWDLARDRTGTVQRVCGPLTSVRVTDDGSFVNVGEDYPSSDRFTFIFWNVFLDPIEAPATICGVGEIYLYDGVVAQIEMWDPGALEIWR